MHLQRAKKSEADPHVPNPERQARFPFGLFSLPIFHHLHSYQFRSVLSVSIPASHGEVVLSFERLRT